GRFPLPLPWMSYIIDVGSAERVADPPDISGSGAPRSGRWLSDRTDPDVHRMDTSGRPARTAQRRESEGRQGWTMPGSVPGSRCTGNRDSSCDENGATPLTPRHWDIQE